MLCDRDELDFERIADQHLVEQRRAPGVVVRVDEAGDDGHPPGVERLRALADQRPHVGAAADRGEPGAGDGERLGARARAVYRVDLRVVDDQVGVESGECLERPREHAGGPGRGKPHEFTACP